MSAGKIASIVALVAVIAVAGYFLIFGGGEGKSTVPADKVRDFQCVNPDCGKAFAEADVNLDDAGPYGGAGVMGAKCPACGQFSVFATRKCEKCGEAYVPTRSYKGPAGDLKCPKCGYDPDEDR